ncbi:MAG: ATP-binding protein, partial [Betaproteobacteria bacterium]
LLAFSRRQQVQPRALDLNAAIANMRRVLVRLIGEDVDLRFEAQADLWPVRCDPAQLDQIVLNLAANARDALPEGGTLAIRTANARLSGPPPGAQLPLRPGEYVLLTISDDGVGIEPALLPRIFEPFLTTKQEGHGTGLGLATVYGIVEQSGGSIAVESASGRGTTFRIYLPRCRESRPAAAATQAGSRELPAATVLLVEDDEHVRAVTAGLLEALGCSVLEAGSGEQALELANRQEERIDLLLTDVVMPRMSGRELGERVAALRPGVAVLYMSGYAAELGEGRAALGPDAHFIQKPFGLDSLAVELSAALGGRARAPAPTA